MTDAVPPANDAPPDPRWPAALALSLTLSLPVLLELGGLARVGREAPAHFIALAADHAHSAPLFWPVVALVVLLSRPDRADAALNLRSALWRALLAGLIFAALGMVPQLATPAHLGRALALAPTALFYLLALRLFAHGRVGDLSISALAALLTGTMTWAFAARPGWAWVLSASLAVAPLAGVALALWRSRSAGVWCMHAPPPPLTLTRAPGLALIWAGAISLALGARLLARQDHAWRSEWLENMAAHPTSASTLLRELAAGGQPPPATFTLWSDWTYVLGAYTPGGFVALAYLLCSLLALVALFGLGLGAARKLSLESGSSELAVERLAFAFAATLVLPLLLAPAPTLHLMGADPLLAYLGIQPARMIAAGLIFVALLFTLLPAALSRSTLASGRYARLGALMLIAPPAALLFLSDHARITPLAVASTISLGAAVLTTLLSLKINHAPRR